MAAWAGIDNFDSYGDGDLHGESGGSGWSDAWGGSTAYDVQGTTTFGGSTKAVQHDTSSTGTIVRTLTSSVDSGDLYYAIRTDDASLDGIQFEIQDGATLGGAVSFENDGGATYQIRVSTHAVADILESLAADTWYIININFVSSTQFKVRAKVEGGSFNAYSSDLTYINSVNNPDRLDMTSFPIGSGQVNLYIDEIGTTDPDAAAAGPAALKTLDTIAAASIKTIDGVAIASVKTWNTIA